MEDAFSFFKEILQQDRTFSIESFDVDSVF